MDIEQMRIRMGEMAAEIDRLNLENEHLKGHSHCWVHYQYLLKSNGFSGITDLLTKYHAQERESARLQSIIDEANAQDPVGIADFQYQRDGTAIVEISLSKQGSINPGDELFTRPIPAQQINNGESSQAAFDAYLTAIGGPDSKLWHDAPVDGVFKDGFNLGLLARPVPAQQSPWLRVIDEALVVQHVGVVDDKDTYSEAKQKLNLLLCAQQSDAMDVSVTSMVQAALDELGPYATALRENQWHRAMHAAMRSKQPTQGARAEFVGVLTLKPSEPVNFTVMQALATLKTEVLGLESPDYAMQLIERIEAEQQSPSVAVPDGLRELIAACRQIGFPVVTEGMKYVIDDMQSALSRVQNSIGAPSPRITEQDAREIAVSAWRHWNAGGGRTVNTFIEEELGALLDKLNDKPEVSGDMQKALGALSDIANADDMTLEMARKKAGRIYNELQPESVGGSDE